MSWGERFFALLPSRRALVWLLVAEVAGIAFLVLNPSPATPSGAVRVLNRALREIGLPPWLVGTGQLEFALNVVLFVPFGLVAAVLWTRVPWWGWVLAGFAASSTLEWLQLTLLSQRTSTSSDIVANTLGVALGAGLVAAARFSREVSRV